MKIRWKRLLSSLVASCLLAAGLVGCSNNQPTETENSDMEPTTSQVETTVVATASAEISPETQGGSEVTETTVNSLPDSVESPESATVDNSIQLGDVSPEDFAKVMELRGGLWCAAKYYKEHIYEHEQSLYKGQGLPYFMMWWTTEPDEPGTLGAMSPEAETEYRAAFSNLPEGIVGIYELDTQLSRVNSLLSQPLDRETLIDTYQYKSEGSPVYLSQPRSDQFLPGVNLYIDEPFCGNHRQVETIVSRYISTLRRTMTFMKTMMTMMMKTRLYSLTM